MLLGNKQTNATKNIASLAEVDIANSTATGYAVSFAASKLYLYNFHILLKKYGKFTFLTVAFFD